MEDTPNVTGGKLAQKVQKSSHWSVTVYTREGVTRPELGMACQAVSLLPLLLPPGLAERGITLSRQYRFLQISVQTHILIYKPCYVSVVLFQYKSREIPCTDDKRREGGGEKRGQKKGRQILDEANLHQTAR